MPKGHDIISKCMEFRIKPEMEQKVLIWKTFGCCRFVWNSLLEERINYEKNNKGKIINTTPAHLKKDNPFLKEVDSLALSNTQLDLNKSCWILFSKGKAPKFRKKGKDKRSYTTNCNYRSFKIISRSDFENYIKLPKLGLVRIILHRSIPDEWKMKHATIKETASGKFFISLVFDVEVEQKEKAQKYDRLEAFDYSMPSLAVSASGENDIRKEDIHWYRNLEGRIAKEQRKLSRMMYGSANYWKQKHKVGALYEKAANRRKDFLHKLSRAVADRFDAVAVEGINLQAMARSLNFGKSVHDNGFGMFRVFLAYKLHARGKILVKIHPLYASSQLCSNCNTKNPEVKDLSVREWVCQECGESHQRDKNACKNLKKHAIELPGRWTSGDSSLILTPLGVLNEKEAPTS